MKIVKNELAKMLGVLREVYRQPPLSNPAFEMYWEDLQGYDAARLKESIRMHRRDQVKGGYMPVPADLLTQLQKIACNLQSLDDQRCQYVGESGRCQAAFTGWEFGEKRCAKHHKLVMDKIAEIMGKKLPGH